MDQTAFRRASDCQATVYIAICFGNIEAYIALPQVGFGANFKFFHEEQEAEVKLSTLNVNGIID